MITLSEWGSEMAMSKHTPGPWLVGYAVRGAFQIEDEYGMVLCTRNYWDNNAEASEANARLIAAAPDLLAMLKVAQLWLDIDGRYDMQGINAVIAKAEGRS